MRFAAAGCFLRSSVERTLNCGDEPSPERRIGADHGVLYSIADQQNRCQVVNGTLRRFFLSEEADGEDDKKANGQRI